MIAELNLMPWMIVWALVTTVVLILAFYRLKVVSHESPGIHVLEKPEVNVEEQMLAQKLLRVDSLGKALTIVSAVLIVAIGMIYGYQTYLKAYEVVGH